MNNESLQELKRRADVAFKNKDFELTLALSEKLAEENVPSALFTCGLILEKGWIDGTRDLDRAMLFYRDLAIKFNDDEGYLGCVRIFLARHDLENRDKAVHYCTGATKGRLKYLALLLLGRTYEDLYEPPERKLARKAYLKSFFAGSAWALRQYAFSLMKSNNVIGSAFMHIVASLISPIYVLIYGARTKRHG